MRFALASTWWAVQAESSERPLARRAARIARPARVRMRRRKPCTLARRRLFGWKVRLLMDVLRGRRWACRRRRAAATVATRGRGQLVKNTRNIAPGQTRPLVEKSGGSAPTAIFWLGDLIQLPLTNTLSNQPRGQTRTAGGARSLHESADEHVLVATGAC